MYGGAAGGGKSVGLVASALQFVDVPRYHALLLRRTFKQLSKSDGLIAISHDWLSHTPAKWSQERYEWLFPSGATLTFGHMEHETSKYDYQGPQWQMIGFDELTQFTQTQYTYMFSRRRRPMDLSVPLRTRATANPGGEGHHWVRQRLVRGGDGTKRLFIPAKMRDNPGLDIAAYREALSEMDPVTRDQLENGNWDIEQTLSVFAAANLAAMRAALREGQSGSVVWEETEEGQPFLVAAGPGLAMK